MHTITPFLLLSLTPMLLFLAPMLRAQQPTRTIHDKQDHLTLAIPTTWQFSTNDHELSTFHQEARTAPKTARFRSVSAMPENPFPSSTFSGAHIYVSFTPSQTAAQCTAQTNPPRSASATRHYLPDPIPMNGSILALDGRTASHGHDEHGALCTEYRDDIYTVRSRNGCLRFDLAMNNFCGGAVSGVRDMTHTEILEVRGQLETILQSVRFDR